MAAQIVTEVEVVTELVDTVKFTHVAPAGTVTLAGTEANAGLLLESGIVVPPVGAVAFRATVPVEGFPPTTLMGCKLNEVRLAVEVTVSSAETLAPP